MNTRYAMLATIRLSSSVYLCLLKAELSFALTPGVIPPNWNAENWHASEYSYSFRETPCPFPGLYASIQAYDKCHSIWEADDYESIPLTSPVSYSHIPIYGQYFAQIVDLVNGAQANSEPQFSFLTISALPTVGGTNSKDLLAPMFLKTALVIWRDGDSVWEFTSASRREMNSLFLDMCPDPTSCNRPDALKRIHRASKGNWTKGQSWAPYRAAIAGRGATSEADDFVYHATVMLTSNTIFTTGFKSNNGIFFNDAVRNTALFVRVDDHKFLALLASIMFFKSVSVQSAVWWLCSNSDSFEMPAAVSSLISTIYGWGEADFDLSKLYYLPSTADTYTPDVGSANLVNWASQIRAVWAAQSRLHIGAFVSYD
jgi:hypothetical protein